MPRHSSIGKRGFIWLPIEKESIYDVTIDSISVRADIMSAKFTRALAPEIGDFEVELENSNEKYTDKYTGGETIELFIDYVDGTTQKFKGIIDTINNKFKDSLGFHLILAGGHVSSELLNIIVTKSYAGEATTSEIIAEIAGDFLTGYTTTNVTTETTKPIINWDNKPFWDCIVDLTKLSGYDCYVDDDKDFHYFKKKSIVNTTDAIVLGQTLIDFPNIGNQTLTQRNKITVIGDDGTGLPVLATTGTGTKEEVIFDSKSTTPDQASAIADAEYSLKSTEGTETEGTALCYFLTSLKPGDMVWLSHPKLKITKQIKIYKYTHMMPFKHTECFIQDDKQVPHILKKRVETELAQQTVTNPFRMTDSWNFKFDNFSELGTWDANIAISESKVKLSSGSQGTFISNLFNIPAGISEVHLLAVSENLSATIELSTDAGTNYVPLTVGEKNVLSNAVGENARCLLRVEINSSTCLIDSIAVLYKN